jgi:prepilin-type N-terminal cleavage/methylation domain-containing protein
VATGAVVRTRRHLGWGHRGQGGLTLVETLIALAVSAVIAAPIFGLLTVTLKARQPAQESNSAYSQFGLARVSLQRDWSRAEIIRVMPTGSPNTDSVGGDGLDCGNAGSTTTLALGPGQSSAVNQSTGIGNELLLSTQSTETYDGVTTKRRTVYVLRHNGTGQPKDLYRRRCERNANGSLDATSDAGGWRTSPGSMNFTCTPPTPPATWPSGVQTIDCGTQVTTVVARNLTDVQVSNTCNTKADPTPNSYEPCDATATFTAVGGETATIRLRQQSGRTYKEGP